jgi:hypothetical protein
MSVYLVSSMKYAAKFDCHFALMKPDWSKENGHHDFNNVTDLYPAQCDRYHTTLSLPWKKLWPVNAVSLADQSALWPSRSMETCRSLLLHVKYQLLSSSEGDL